MTCPLVQANISIGTARGARDTPARIGVVWLIDEDVFVRRNVAYRVPMLLSEVAAIRAARANGGDVLHLTWSPNDH